MFLGRLSESRAPTMDIDFIWLSAALEANDGMSHLAPRRLGALRLVDV
jgi:hypothetical protein